ncbi:MAG: hypothetical protein IJ960_00430 [Oscillospiraceae bacterium]|nr:hypothetical protein [Oscillospiraceae bacterium]
MSPKQNTNLWITAACAAPLAHWAGIGWLATALAAAAAVPLCWLPGSVEHQGKPLGIAQWLWTAAVLGSLVPAAGNYWTGGGKAVGLILLTLAALAGRTAQRERSGNTLFWLLAPVGGLILLLAAGKLEWIWLEPQAGKWPGELLCILLVPALTGKEKKGTQGILAGLTAIGAAILIQGTLGHQTAAAASAPLYETGKALGPGGEILVSVGMTLSWYALASLLFGKAMEFLREAGIPSGWAAAVTWAMSGAMVLLELKIPGTVLAAGSLILWVILPLFRSMKK